MHKKSLLFSISTAILLTSGCYERGKYIPSLHDKISTNVQTKEKEKIEYDFPLLKITANPSEKPSKKPSKNHSRKIDNNTTQRIETIKVKKEVPAPATQSTQLPALPKLPTTKPLNSITKPVPVPKDTAKNKVEKKNTPKATPKSTKKALKKKKASSKDKPFYLKDKLAKLNGFSLKNIPIINTVIPEKSKINHPRIKQSTKPKVIKRHKPTRTSSEVQNRADIPITQIIGKQDQTDTNTSSTQTLQTFSGGQNSNKLDMGLIQIDLHGEFTSLTLGSYEWGGYNVAPVNKAALTGLYSFKYEPYNNRIVGTLEGYKAFSSLINSQSELFNKSDLINVIYIDRYIGKDKIKFIIELSKKVKVSITDLQDPAKIIINLYPDK
ncbi:MAG: hypothetical protein U9N11_07905 [Campylobacterota bacterium]|nr:hypothetical protein [Campylobacterota bacterium]